jgi:exodeoxyribonuclease V gamma subunit
MAEQIGARFADYAVWRQPMLRRWWAGDDVAADGTALASEQRWQVWMWRQTTGVLGLTPWEEADAVRLACADRAVDFARIAVFCPETWSPLDQQVLGAIASVHPVMVFDQPTPPSEPVRSADEVEYATHRFNLVPRLVDAALGDCAPVESECLQTATTADNGEAPDSLLQRLQRCFNEGVAPTCVKDEPYDGSVQFYATPADSQAEVVADVVTDALSQDPTLEPRDILVVLHQAGEHRDQFDAVLFRDEDPSADASHRLRAAVATRDEVSEQTLDLLDYVMSLVQGRASAEDLLRLCGVPLLREHFGIGDDQAPRLRALVEAAGIRWGVNAADRAADGMADFAQNTWLAGLGRMTLGVALREDDLVWRGTVLPIDAVDSDTVRLVGCLGQIMAQVRSCCQLWPQATTPAQWAVRLRDCAGALVGAVSPLASAVIAALAESPSAELTLPEAERLLSSTRQGFFHQASFLNGDLAVTSPGTMDLVPFKVVIVAGLDADHFPRPKTADGDDVGNLSSSPQLEPSSRDYQRLRDAVMSARQRLIVIFDGFDSTTSRPSLTAVSELMTLCELSSQAEPDSGQLCRVVSSGRSQSAASARLVTPEHTLPTAMARVSAAAPSEVTLDDFCALFANPAAHWLRRSAGLLMSALKPTEPIPEVMPVDMTPLTRWIVTDTMMRLLQAGHSADTIVEAELRRGYLPPASAGRVFANDCLAHATSILQRAQSWLAAPPQWVAVELPVSGEAPSLNGQIQVHDATVCQVSAGRVKPSAQLSAWITLLCLTVVEPNISWQAILIGNRTKVTLHAPPAPQATRHLSYLRQIHRRGLDSPLPLPPALVAHLARCLKLDRSPNPGDVTRMLHRDWDRDPAWKLLWSTPTRLLTEPAQPGDIVAALEGGGDTTRVTALARGAYLPVLQAGGVV